MRGCFFTAVRHRLIQILIKFHMSQTQVQVSPTIAAQFNFSFFCPCKNGVSLLLTRLNTHNVHRVRVRIQCVIKCFTGYLVFFNQAKWECRQTAKSTLWACTKSCVLCTSFIPLCLQREWKQGKIGWILTEGPWKRWYQIADVSPRWAEASGLTGNAPELLHPDQSQIPWDRSSLHSNLWMTLQRLRNTVQDTLAGWSLNYTE